MKEYEEMIKQLMGLPEERMAKKNALLALKRKQEMILYDKKGIEIATQREVSRVTDNSGKPLFTNEKMREAETFERLKNITEYQKLFEEEHAVITKMQEKETEISYLNDVLRVADIVTRYMEVR